MKLNTNELHSYTEHYSSSQQLDRRKLTRTCITTPFRRRKVSATQAQCHMRLSKSIIKAHKLSRFFCYTRWFMIHEFVLHFHKRYKSKFHAPKCPPQRYIHEMKLQHEVVSEVQVSLELWIRDLTYLQLIYYRMQGICCPRIIRCPLEIVTI